ncbi:MULTISPECIES: isopenicillin N synthase family dioxygenase [Sphingobium]|uniref:2-oxoglutarate-dependent ethylene/succinate-forming enzyme n=1 Tax=Sphingobium yanoikuyae TaxID=13690 RepID=A0A177JPJ0_SPHYA|nr:MULTISPECIES: 2-oxoglutarate and iron-dependent oxygenase domain-containing protein [Sphingobium]OAH42696.1 flavonol synthase [Sphingobium yanoikuyae]PZU63405.1 MAG: isopenicillin N synthase family oxygenase [Sphingobium sp.]QCB39126.1 isopenicillin N synthase family oxygenase [Sphingobium sp. PAMC28499]WBQ18100.1 isopenicillin N synthase family oxygenase [Sphingobium yanoikuyae]
MSQSVLDQVPVLSMAEMSKGDFAAAFGGSFQRFGFAMVKDHGMDQALVDKGWALAREFFAQPVEMKRAYDAKFNGGQRGYTAFGVEIAKGASENDLKEFWHVGRDLAPGDPLAETMPPNVWPTEMPAFRDVFAPLYAEFDRVGAELLSAIALYLGLPERWFDGPIKDGNSILRLLHYPPVSPEAPGIRAGAHEDINLITLLLGAEEGGLELKDRDGNWLPVVPPPGALAINVGDMLQRLTNHVLPSTSHRVVNPPPERRGHSRYSMPFFLHLRPDFMIDALPQCVTPDNPRREAPISAHDYLTERLIEIGLIKKA